LRGLLLSDGEGRKGNGKGKGEQRGDHVEGGIWPTQKFLVWRPFARPLAGFKGVALRQGGEGREGRGKERKGRRGAGRRKMGDEESWNRAAD